MFNRFYRLKKSCDKREGIGLGLAIVKTVIELHASHGRVADFVEKW